MLHRPVDIATLTSQWFLLIHGELGLQIRNMRRFVLDRLNRWLTLVANVGVVAGIVFLGLEIQQTSDVIKAQIY